MSYQVSMRENRAVKSPAGLTFKIASEDWEFEQIFRLNYRTFVEEIPQHSRSSNGTLVDKFHRENTYIICLKGDQLLGMVAARGKRPFSLDQKLDNLDDYLPQARPICEIRLLAVDGAHRHGRVFKGLLTKLALHCRRQGYELAIISGTVREQPLFERLGCVPFGPLVGAPDAMYQPMYRLLDTFERDLDRLFRRMAPDNGQAPVNLLPGPVGVSHDVRKAFGGAPVSHRSEAFVEDFKRTKRLLCQLVGSRRVEILMGSGTLANDVIAAQLSLIAGRGVILSNGEFGDRLIDHASRFRMSFETLHVPWGRTFDRDRIERTVDQSPETEWLWAVHCETSTGVLNDMTVLKEVCAKRGIRLCVDCISSVGTVPVDLSGVHLASCVSGKGLGAFPGLSMVFHEHDVLPAPQPLPRYLDLGLLVAKQGVPFTMSSNLVYALQAALKRFASKEVFEGIVNVSAGLRHRLREFGFQVVAPEAHASPAVITIALPVEVDSGYVGRRLEEAGYLLSYNSEYLLTRNWIQICLMGEWSPEAITPLLDVLREFRPLGRAAP